MFCNHHQDAFVAIVPANSRRPASRAAAGRRIGRKMELLSARLPFLASALRVARNPPFIDLAALAREAGASTGYLSSQANRSFSGRTQAGRSAQWPFDALIRAVPNRGLISVFIATGRSVSDGVEICVNAIETVLFARSRGAGPAGSIHGTVPRPRRGAIDR